MVGTINLPDIIVFELHHFSLWPSLQIISTFNAAPTMIVNEQESVLNADYCLGF